MLLLHGWTLDLEVWESLVAALRDNHRVVSLDRRGFGRSTGQPSIELDVHDIGSLCAHLQLQRLAVVGMSQGCRAALAYTCYHPGQVSCLALDGPPEFDSSIAGANVSLAPFRELVRAQGLAAFRQQWLQHPLMRLRTDNAETRALLARVVEHYPGADLSEAATDAAPPELANSIEALKVPVLVITGEHDLPNRVQSADRLARRLPAGERAVVADSGHLASLDNPASYNTLLAAFLSRH